MEQHTLKFIPENKYPSQCLITLYRQSDVVVATDIDKGMSRSADAVTNACATIANEVVRQFLVNPQRMIFIEQYRPGTRDQTTDLVRFKIYPSKGSLSGQLYSPQWTHLPNEEFNRLIAVADEVEVM